MQCFEYKDIAAGTNLSVFKERKVFADLSNVSQVQNFKTVVPHINQGHLPKCNILVPCFNQKIKKDLSTDPQLSRIANSILEESMPSQDLDHLYMVDVYKHLKECEVSYRVDINALNCRKGISMDNRTALIDWLIESSINYPFSSEMIHKAVYYVDRFLTGEDIELQEFQELGVSALFLAFKFEDSSPPPSSFLSEELIYFSKSLSKQMEQKLLKSLNFRLGYPSALYFIDIYCSVLASPLKIDYYMLQYLSELMLLDASICAKYLPSEIAAACYILAYILDYSYPEWPQTLISFTGLELSDLMELVEKMKSFYSLLVKSNYKSVARKYSSLKFNSVHLILLHKNALKV